MPDQDTVRAPGHPPEHGDDLNRRALERAETLLWASQAFTDTVTVSDVRTQVRALAAEMLGAGHVSMLVADEAGRLYRHDPDRPRPRDPLLPPVVPADSGFPSTTAFRDRTVLHYPDRDSFDRHHGPAARRALRELGMHCLVATPLPSAAGPMGALVLTWPTPHAVEPTDLLTITTLAGFAAQALGRAQVLAHRVTVASEMQQAMLTTLPVVPGVTLAARYLPADSREHVGGDWYDAARMTDPTRPDDLLLGVTVGDIVGHALPAVSLMGNARSMLRQAAWDRASRPPSVALEAFEDANTGLDVGAAGTAVLAHLRRTDGRNWTVTWTNAGHPPPVLLHPDGRAELLTGHDPLFGYQLTGPGERTDHTRAVEPGTTLFLYTDGLVERRDNDIDHGINHLLDTLTRHHHRGVRALVDAVINALAHGSDDDVVALAVRVTPTTSAETEPGARGPRRRG